MPLHVVKLSIPVQVGAVPGLATVEQKLADGVITGIEIDFQGATGIDKVGVQLWEREARFVPAHPLSSEAYIWHRGFQVRVTDHIILQSDPPVIKVVGTNTDTGNTAIAEVRITTQRITPQNLLQLIANGIDAIVNPEGGWIAKLLDIIT